MEDIARAYLERGDVSSALPILSTLALAAANSAVQRRRRLLHARIHREATAVSSCLAGNPLSDEQRQWICDAILDKDLPHAVFFGPPRVPCADAEVTRRLQLLRLAVHPDKCKSERATAAITALHERREEYTAKVAAIQLATSASATTDTAPVTSLPQPSGKKASVTKKHSPPLSQSAPASALPPVVLRTSSTRANSTGSPASPSSPIKLSRTWREDPNPRASASPTIASLIGSMRSTCSVKLETDLSFESCMPAGTLPDAPSASTTPAPADLERVLATNVQAQFDRLRNSLVSDLRAKWVCDNALGSKRGLEAAESSLEGALFASLNNNQSR
jgi:hypothetical protein